MAIHTADEIIRRVRTLLQDSTVPYRYLETELIDAINDGQDRMVELRPDYFINENFDPDRVTTAATVLQIPTRLIYALVLFTSGYMMLREDEFSNDGRATALMGAAGRMVTRPPV